MFSGGFNVGRIFGIDINIDFSWIFIFLLITWNLAAGVFPTLHPNWSPALSWGVGISASFLFFSSVLAHELAHSLVAKSHGLPVHRIILFLFGGVSDLEREPPSPSIEFFTAIVGPLTSIVLGLIFLFLGGLTGGVLSEVVRNPAGVLSNLDPITTLLVWLGPANILLGLFNMIPGFPLDGGRVLRSIIWVLTGNLKFATLIAATVGRLVAWAFIITGVLMILGIKIPIFGSGLVEGIWLIFIGLFLNMAASRSYLRAVKDKVLQQRC